MSRSATTLAVAMLAASMAACSGEPAPPPAAATAAEPVAIPLPASVAFPEGIAYDAAAGALYTASAADGAVLRLDAATGTSEVVTPGGILVPRDSTTFPGPLGMTLDEASRLWIAGGNTGRIWVIDTTSGAVAKDAAVATAGKSLINDVVVVDNAAYFTDTFVPTLWRVAVEGDTIGDPEPWLDLTGSPIEYVEGPNLNGIAVTPDGQTLIVVHMGKGLLFTIDIATKAITPVDTAGADLTGADGLVLDGNTLYVVRQTAVEIATLELSADRSTATVVSRFEHDGLAWPATAVKVDGDLVVVNTQFNTRDDNSATLPFTLLRVPVTRLSVP